ncbi:MAG: hypothetical protein HZA28_06020 [Candidatus Omnitrophica bacterium]|nr:hypothetical protein [Candidatus Omnitrophota bacterium]
MPHRRLNRLVFISLVLFLGGTQAGYACSVCFGGSSQDPANIGLRNGVIFLLAVVLLVLASFARFFLNIRKRTKLMVDQS